MTHTNDQTSYSSFQINTKPFHDIFFLKYFIDKKREHMHARVWSDKKIGNILSLVTRIVTPS